MGESKNIIAGEKLELFRKYLDNKPIRIISSNDLKGILCSSLLIKSFKREKLKFSYSTLNQDFEELKAEDLGLLILVNLDDEKLIENYGKIITFNNDDFDDVIELCYLFSLKLNPKNSDLDYFSLIHDSEKKLEEMENKVEIKNILNMNFLDSPLNFSLAHTPHFFIPGVSGDEKKSSIFLENNGIKIKIGKNYKRLLDLNEEEIKELTALIYLNSFGTNKKETYEKIYLLKEKNMSLEEIRKITIACIKLNKASLAVGLYIGNKKTVKKVIELFKDYNLEIVKGLEWFYHNKKQAIEVNKCVILNSEDTIKDLFTGEVAEKIVEMELYPLNSLIFFMANTIDGKIKVSCRSKGDTDLLKIVSKIGERIKAEYGGNKRAAGLLFDANKEKVFIEEVKNVFGPSKEEEEI